MDLLLTFSGFYAYVQRLFQKMFEPGTTSRRVTLGEFYMGGMKKKWSWVLIDPWDGSGAGHRSRPDGAQVDA